MADSLRSGLQYKYSMLDFVPNQGQALSRDAKNVDVVLPIFFHQLSRLKT